MSDVTINRLPQPTWHRLRVNQINVSCPDSFDRAAYEVSMPEQAAAVLTEENETFGISGLGEQVPALCGEKCLTLTLPADSACEDAVYVRADAADACLRLHIRAGENSDYRVVVLLTGEGSGVSLLRLTAEVGTHAKLHVAVSQLMGHSVTSLQDFCARVGDEASLTMTQLELGGGFVCVGNRIELSGKRSDYQADMGYRLKEQRLDVNLVARHTGPYSTSRMDARGLLDEQGIKCFRDTIDFVRGCHGAVGSETEDVLMLGDEVVNQSVPLILCDEEDVDGSHGATIGRLDEASMYYLATRGIDEVRARSLIAAARMRAVCELIPCEQAREVTMAWLSDALEEAAPC